MTFNLLSLFGGYTNPPPATRPRKIHIASTSAIGHHHWRQDPIYFDGQEVETLFGYVLVTVFPGQTLSIALDFIVEPVDLRDEKWIRHFCQINNLPSGK